MPNAFSTDWNPAKVMMGQNQGGSPYLNTGRPVGPAQGFIGGQKSGGIAASPAKPAQGFIGSTTPAQQPFGTLGAEAVRATGSGPFDAAFRQNLSTYAGGQFQRPGGYLGFNPTGGLFGNPTGGGTDPVLGMPNDLMSLALGGQSFQYTAPQPPKSNVRKPVSGRPSWLDWNHGGRGYGRYFG